MVEHRVALLRVPESVSLARERVGRILGHHPLLDNVLLVTSELVTNSIVHAVGPRCDLVIENRPPWVTVHVLDYGGTGEPRLSRSDDPLALSGRGLDIVDLLATLTWDRTGDTLTVSAVMPKPDPQAGTDG